MTRSDVQREVKRSRAAMREVWLAERSKINTNLIAREMDLENRLFEVEKCNMSIHEIAVAASKSKERMNGGQATCSKHRVELAQREDMPSCSFSICV